MTRREPSGDAVLSARIVSADPRVTPDERDAAILARRAIARDAIQGHRVGDFIVFADGTVGRFTHSYGDAIQTTVRGGQFGDGSFYLCESGGLSYSGALDPAIPIGRLQDTGESRHGSVWFFHRDWHCAHNAVQAEIPCRVYRETSLPGEAEAVSV